MGQQSYRSLVYVAVVLAAVAFPTVLRFIQTLLAILQTPLSPLTAKSSEQDCEPGEVTGFAISALAKLGFTQRCFTTEISYDDERYTVWYFIHNDQPVIAALSNRPSMLASRPVAFYSFDEAGNSLVTFNRVGAYFGRIQQPKVLAVDGAYASIEDHYRAHLARLSISPCPAVNPSEALRRISERIEGQFEWLRATGEIHLAEDGRWFYTFPVALRLTTASLQVAKWWRLPYTGPEPRSVEETGRRDLEMFEILRKARERRSSRSNVKLALFCISLTLAFVGWGLFFDWTMAAALIAILLLHECGHAVAMRAFGHKDISLFFVPFMGAVVTGSPRDMSAFRQTIILLAGPVPGLVLGVLALLYTVSFAAEPSAVVEQIALLAIMINLFNLLPITPLDGGQLLELAIFGRWPRARLVFYILSILVFAGLALHLQAPSLWVLATLLALGVVHQIRASRLIAFWKPGLAHQEQVANLFQAARRIGMAAFTRSYALVVSVMARKAVRSAKGWEAALIAFILTTVWLTTSAIAFGPQIARSGEHSTLFSDRRTVQQREFDTKYLAFEESDQAGDDDLRVLDQIAASIPDTDPRHIDLQVEHVERLDDHQQFDRFLAILSEHRDGLENSRAVLARMALSDLSSELQADTEDQREVKLQKGVDRVMDVMPEAFPQTIWTRLEIIELVDHRLGMSEAEMRLDRLRQEASSRDDCHCNVSAIAEAQAWFYLTHGRPADALASLQPSSPEEGLPGTAVQRARAWALLESGQSAQGQDVMLQATYVPASRPKFLDVLRLNFKTRRAYYNSPVDLAYAYHANNRDVNAREMLASHARDECESAGNGLDDPGPWQELRVRKLQGLLRQLCSKPSID